MKSSNNNRLPEDLCQAVVGNYPDPRTGHASGSFLENQPLVCGGSGDGEKTDIHPLCYVVDKSRAVAFMEHPRSMAARMYDNEARTLWITGGWTSKDYLVNRRSSITNTTEFVSLHEEPSLGPVMPHGLAGHCIVMLNGTTAILIGGLTGTGKPSRWFIFVRHWKSNFQPRSPKSSS